MVLWAAMKKGTPFVSIADDEEAVRRKLPKPVYDFVADVVRILRTERQRAMGLTGRPSLG